MLLLLPAFIATEAGRALLTSAFLRSRGIELRPSAIATLSEAFKLAAAFAGYVISKRLSSKRQSVLHDGNSAEDNLSSLIRNDPLHVLKYAIPALCYLANTMLYFIALQKADPALVHMILMAKFPLTAILYHFIIRPMRNGQAWAALAVLTGSLVAFTAISSGQQHQTNNGLSLALISGLVISFVSACISVYTEVLLKSTAHFWSPQILLYLFGFLFALPLSVFWDGTLATNAAKINVMSLDWHSISVTILLATVSAVAGLLVAAILRQKDNLVKLVGNATVIIAVFIGQAILFPPFKVTSKAVMAGGAALISVWAYNALLLSDRQKHDSNAQTVFTWRTSELKQDVPFANAYQSKLSSEDARKIALPTIHNISTMALAVLLVASLINNTAFTGLACGLRGHQAPHLSSAGGMLSGADLIRLIFSNFTVPRGSPEHLPPNPLKPTGDADIPHDAYIPTVDPSKVCIMQADDRPAAPFVLPATYHNIADLQAHNFSALPAEAASLYYNAWYAMRHGYHYIRKASTAPEGWHHTWSKIPALQDVIAQPECEYTVFLDGDAFFNEPSIDLQDMLKRWGFHNRMSFLWSADPRFLYSSPNTGFGIFRNTDITRQMLAELLLCPEEIPACEKYKINRLNEQDAFQFFLRDHYKLGEEWTLSSCYETDGWSFWRQANADALETGEVEACRGSIISHGWWHKDLAAGRMADIISTEMLAWVASQYDAATGRFSWDRSERI